MLRNKEIELPDLLNIAIDDLGSNAEYLRVMALGRPEREAATILRAADKITKLGYSLGKMIED